MHLAFDSQKQWGLGREVFPAPATAGQFGVGQTHPHSPLGVGDYIPRRCDPNLQTINYRNSHCHCQE